MIISGHSAARGFTCVWDALPEQVSKKPTRASCTQKRTILMAEHLHSDVLLKLPHRQFVFTVPRALRIFFRNDRKLFADLSRLIFSIIKGFYKEAAGKKIMSGMVTAHQTFGDMLRWNPHYHCIVLEGGFDENRNFVYISFSGLHKMTEYFKHKVIELFLKNNLINEGFAKNPLSWRNSGFSIRSHCRAGCTQPTRQITLFRS